MVRRDVWRDGEERIISVTPVAWGLLRPVLSVVTAVALVQYAAAHLSLVRAHEALAMLLLAGPCLLLVVTRTWRWRSHKVHVTSQRVILEGGVLRHHRTAVELADVVTSRVEQHLGERLIRRGWVVLETAGGPVTLGKVSHPDALVRLIDTERLGSRVTGLDPVGGVGRQRQSEYAFRRDPDRRATPRWSD